MQRRVIALILLCTFSKASLAANEGENQAHSFATLYASLCLKHLNNLDELREKLKPIPKLPPEKAAFFLGGRQGNAWPIPDKHGTFVLAIPSEKHLCAVHARRADTETAIAQFLKLVSTAPAPLTAKEMQNEHAQTPSNGQTHTISYAWSANHSSRKLLFTLTTAPLETAQLQVLGTAAIISD